MSCPICTNKAANCDCTEGDRRAYDLESENAELRFQIDQLEEALNVIADWDGFSPLKLIARKALGRE